MKSQIINTLFSSYTNYELKGQQIIQLFLLIQLFYYELVINKSFKFGQINNTENKGLKTLQRIKERLNLKYNKSQLLFQGVETYIFGNEFNQCINYNQILLKYNFLIVHVWLIQQRLNEHSIKNMFIKKQLDSLLYKSASNYIYQFDDNYNQEMKQELERNQLVINFTLDDYFHYQFTKKTLKHIIYEDILLSQENDENQLDKICKYIELNYEQIKKIEQSELEQGKIKWIQ